MSSLKVGAKPLEHTDLVRYDLSSESDELTVKELLQKYYELTGHAEKLAHSVARLSSKNPSGNRAYVAAVADNAASMAKWTMLTLQDLLHAEEEEAKKKEAGHG